MSDEAELYLQRAENELVAAQMLFKVSNNQALQKEQFKLEKEFTFTVLSLVTLIIPSSILRKQF